MSHYVAPLGRELVFNMDDICKVCGERYGLHLGTLCPKDDPMLKRKQATKPAYICEPCETGYHSKCLGNYGVGCDCHCPNTPAGMAPDAPTAEAPASSGIRQFETGANRNSDTGKFDYEGFLSPLVIYRFGEYMHKNRHLEDGSLRDSDNWQKGIPRDQYMKSLWRHFFEVWLRHRFPEESTVEIDEALCGLLFNAQGYLHEYLKERNAQA